MPSDLDIAEAYDLAISTLNDQTIRLTNDDMREIEDVKSSLANIEDFKGFL